MNLDVALHVVKIGGSLLVREDFVPAIRGWVCRRLEADQGIHLVLLVGGGPLVDSLRQLDRLRPTDQELVHWTAIELMEVAGRLVGDWIPEWPVESSLEGLFRRSARPGVTLFLPLEFLRHHEPRCGGAPLPAGWQVTSDSIAARLADVVGAEGLTLLKSTPPPGGPWREWWREGYVDEHFAQAAAMLGDVSAQALPPETLHGTKGSVEAG